MRIAKQVDDTQKEVLLKEFDKFLKGLTIDATPICKEIVLAEKCCEIYNRYARDNAIVVFVDKQQ